MARFLGSVAISLLLAGLIAIGARSQSVQLIHMDSPAGAAVYAGPGDLGFLNTAGYLMRAWSAATKGNVAINVCNVSDVVCADMSTDATTGALVVTTIGGSDCSSVTCTIKKWYNQLGTSHVGDLVQNTIANRATLNTNCISSKPCAAFVRATDMSYTATTDGVLVASTLSAVAMRTSDTTLFHEFWVAPGFELLFVNAVNKVGVYGGSVVQATGNDSVWHAIQGIPGGSGVVNVDGAESTGSTGGGLTCTGYTLGHFCTGPDPLGGNLTEALVFGTTMSGGQRTSICQNQQAFYGSGNFGAVC